MIQGSYSWADAIELDGLSVHAEVEVEGEWVQDRATGYNGGDHEVEVKAYIISESAWNSQTREWTHEPLLRVERGSPFFNVLDNALADVVWEGTRADARSE